MQYTRVFVSYTSQLKFLQNHLLEMNPLSIKGMGDMRTTVI